MRKLALFLFVLAVLSPTPLRAQMDKALHTSAGFGITITVSAATNKPKLGFVAGIGAGVGKELWDSQRANHQASFRDCFATVAGSSAAYVLYKYALNRPRRPQIATAPPAPEQAPPSAAATATTTPSSTPPATQAGGTLVPLH